MKISLPVAAIAAALLLPYAALAEVRTWTGSVSTHWSDNGNWAEGSAPAPADDIVVDGGYANILTIDFRAGAQTAASLTVGTSAPSQVVFLHGEAVAPAVVITGSVLIGPQGILTHPAQQGDVAELLYLDVGGEMTIDAGGAIDVVGLGFEGGAEQSAGSGPGAGPTDGNEAAGAGHGGNGGDSRGAGTGTNYSIGGPGYGSITAPTTPGSSGGGGARYVGAVGAGGGAGGGAVRLIVAGTCTLEGGIRVGGSDAVGYDVGYGAGGGGAGGSLWLDVGSLSGWGSIDATGGRGGRSPATHGGGGGGGHISVSYDTYPFRGTIVAGAGVPGYTEPNMRAGAGTIFLKDRAQPYGTLSVDNQGKTGKGTLATEDVAVQVLTIAGLARLVVVDGTTVTLHNTTIDTPGRGALDIAATGNFVADDLTALLDIDVQNYGTLNLPMVASIGNTVVTNYGVYNHSGSTLTVEADSTWQEAGQLPTIGDVQVITDLVVEGTLSFYNQSPTQAATFDTILISDGGRLLHKTNGAAEEHTLNLVASEFTLATGAVIDVTGMGYARGERAAHGYGPGRGTYDGNVGAGGAHGGNAGHSGSNGPDGGAYGSMVYPTAIGSGGGGAMWHYGGNGGGAVKLIVAGTCLIDGTLRADGVAAEHASAGGGSAGGGAGGSIWIEAATLSGQGSMSARGGLGGAHVAYGRGGGGGGGRISATYDAMPFSGSILAPGARGGRADPNVHGGAGTVYLRDRNEPHGRLLIDNQALAGHDTPSLEEMTLSELTIQGEGRFEVTEATTTTIIGALNRTTIGSPDAGSLIVAATATLLTQNVLSVANLQVTNFGTLNLPDVTSITGSVVTNHGIYNHSSSTLNIEVDTTWFENGTLPTIGDTQAITDFVVVGTLEFWNQSDSVSALFDSMTVSAGGLLTHRANDAEHLNTLHLELTSLLVESSGMINLSGRGFAGGLLTLPGSGPGAGTYNAGYGSGGASHGGVGGMGEGTTTGSPGVVYGSEFAPAQVGSGGGGSDADMGAAGGGAVKLIVSGVATLDGTISADGANLAGVATALRLLREAMHRLA